MHLLVGDTARGFHFHPFYRDTPKKKKKGRGSKRDRVINGKGSKG